MAKRKLVVQNVFSKGELPDPDAFFACVRAYIRLAREQCEKAYERLLSESADGTNERTSADRLTEYLTPDTVSRPLAQCLISSIAVSHRTDDGAIPVTIRWRF